MPRAPLRVSAEAARRFHRRAVLLDTPAASVGAVLAHLGYVQVDPINICGRMHDHILRNRVAGYREGDLMRHLHGDGQPLALGRRPAFEHHIPDSNILVSFPLEAWPHLRRAMKLRTRTSSAWSGRLTGREREFAGRLLAEIAGRGPLSSGQIEDDRSSTRSGWGDSSLAKSTLQKLFAHGRLLIARRDKHRRMYDLPERVLPAEILGLAEPSGEDTARWLAVMKLRQRRLVTLKRAELRLVAGLVQPVAVDGCPPLFCLQEDAAWFEPPARGDARAADDLRGPLLVAPLDPLIYDRRVTRSLWGFDYTWEAYTPAAKRKRGYYALPILAGTELVGHVDLKAYREIGKLRVVSRRLRRGHRVAAAVRDLAGFLGLRA